MKKRMLATVVVTVVVAVALVWLLAGRGEERAGVTPLGAILPLTGDSAQWGIPARNGAQLAVDEINSAGGVGGSLLELSIEDTTCIARDGISAFNKILATKQPIAVIGAVCSSVTLAVAPVAEDDGVVFISPASTNPDITEAGDYVFRVIPSDALRGQVFAEYLFETLGYRRVAILYVNNEGGVGNRDAFCRHFVSLGGEEPPEETYPEDAIDVRSQLTRIQGLDGIEALVVVSYPRDTIMVLRQIRELGIEHPLFFQTEAVEDANVLREAAGTAEGVTYILAATPAGDPHEAFKEAYRRRHGSDPELYAAESYDIVQLIGQYLQGLPEASEVTSAGLRDFLYNVTLYEGASGTISFDENGDVIKPMAIKKIEDGVPTVVKTAGT